MRQDSTENRSPYSRDTAGTDEAEKTERNAAYPDDGRVCPDLRPGESERTDGTGRGSDGTDRGTDSTGRGPDGTDRATDGTGRETAGSGESETRSIRRRKRPFHVRIRKVNLDSASGQDDGGKRNTEIVIVTYLFICLLVLLAVWVAYLEIFRRDDLNSNINNNRRAGNADSVIRGDIVTGDGTVLATTNIGGDGSETRSYPYANIFAHVIGYASNGSAGLEAQENYDLLSSHTNLLSQIQKRDNDEKVQGDKVVVTLNESLQQTAYYALGSYRGAVVVMEPDSGKILAMVSKPDFDPNTISEQWENLVADESSGVLLNRATQGLYPPGSTFKMLTALAYLREHPSDYQQFSWD